jgi:diaminopimelate decarboxylase
VSSSSGEHVVGGVGVSALAARLGRTPFFAYDRARIAARIAELRRALPAGVRILYSMKANPLPALVDELSGLVDGIDVASAGELAIAVRTGTAPARIGFAGPGKTDDELDAALAAGAVVHLESPGEMGRYARLAGERSVRAPVVIRVNPPFQLERAGLRMGGDAAPFGVDAEDVPAMLRALPRELDLLGFHVFAGSQCLDAAAIADAQARTIDLVAGLVAELPAHASAPVRSVNLGGGLGVPYFAGERALDLAELGDRMHRVAAAAADRLPGAVLAIELGRYLVAEAGAYVCRVVDRKVSRGRVFLVTDGGMHHHLAAAGRLGGAIRRNFPVVTAGGGASEEVTVVGRLCTPLDVLADRIELPRLAAGDLIAILQSGAYGPSASPGRFLGHPPIDEVLV